MVMLEAIHLYVRIVTFVFFLKGKGEVKIDVII